MIEEANCIVVHTIFYFISMKSAETIFKVLQLSNLKIINLPIKFWKEFVSPCTFYMKVDTKTHFVTIQ